MRNPFKLIRDKIGHKKPVTGPPFVLKYETEERLKEIWPDGTWTLRMPGVKAKLSLLDEAARNWLLSVSEYEESRKWRAEYGDKLKWPTYPSVAPGWRPSLDDILGCAKELRWEDAEVKYFIARLETLGHLRP